MTLDQPAKPREFWIYEVKSEVAENGLIRVIRTQPTPLGDQWDTIRVIEFSALEAAQARVSLAEQDRDSWKSNFTIQKEAANGLIKKLQEQLAAVTRERDDLKCGADDRIRLIKKERDEARRERDELKASDNAQRTLVCNLKIERDQLRAEVERLKAEIELHMQVDYGSKKWKEAQAEIEQLKSRISNP